MTSNSNVVAVDSLWDKVRPLLFRVERPSRYIDSEWGSAVPQPGDFRIGLCYPGTYEVGQANQALQILYAGLNAREGIAAERVFLPWIDLIEEMNAADVELFSLESFRPVKSLDILGITLPYELSYTSILEVLTLSRIPLYAADRDESFPLIMGGGPCAFNPEPVATFFDAFLLGEGEEAFVEIAETYRASRDAGLSKQECLAKLSTIEGVYVPSLYEVTYTAEGFEGEVASITPKGDTKPLVKKRVLFSLSDAPAPTNTIVPYADVVHNRFAPEILRGCTRGCRFCQAGMIYRPVRERSADEIVSAVMKGLRETGFDEASLTSLSSADHSQLEEVLRRLNARLEGTGIGISLPSLRVDAFSIDMARLMAGSGRKTGLTFAPEAGSQRLRDVINKNVTEEELMATVASAFGAGWHRIKLYFMIGLPTETDDDVRAIGELTQRVFQVARENTEPDKRGAITIGVSVSTFVPKSHTPFQWEPQDTLEEIRRKHQLLRETMPRKGVKLSYHDAEVSYLEGIIARGDRRLADVLVKAHENGSRFDAWSEQFQLSRWLQAFDEDVDIDGYAHRRRDADEVLPWSHLSTGVSNKYLLREARRATEGKTTADCSFDGCTGCDACQNLNVDIVLGGEMRA